jgi:hypothetical protein
MKVSGTEADAPSATAPPSPMSRTSVGPCASAGDASARTAAPVVAAMAAVRLRILRMPLRSSLPRPLRSFLAPPLRPKTRDAPGRWRLVATFASEALTRDEVASALLRPGHFSVPASDHAADEQCHRHREDEPDGNTPGDPHRGAHRRCLLDGYEAWPSAGGRTATPASARRLLQISAVPGQASAQTAGRAGPSDVVMHVAAKVARRCGARLDRLTRERSAQRAQDRAHNNINSGGLVSLPEPPWMS